MQCTYLRKYCSPARRLSRNLGRNLEMTLLGGRGGIAAWELGKVWSKRSRRLSNSEKRLRMRNEAPWGRLAGAERRRRWTYAQRLDGDIPDNKGANAGAVAIDDDVVFDAHALGPAGLVAGVGGVVIIFQGYGAGHDGLDGDVREGPLVRLDPIRRRGRGRRGGRWR
jgi:hypothetical protein